MELLCKSQSLLFEAHLSENLLLLRKDHDFGDDHHQIALDQVFTRPSRQLFKHIRIKTYPNLT